MFVCWVRVPYFVTAVFSSVVPFSIFHVLDRCQLSNGLLCRRADWLARSELIAPNGVDISPCVASGPFSDIISGGGTVGPEGGTVMSRRGTPGDVTLLPRSADRERPLLARAALVSGIDSTVDRWRGC